MWNGKVRCIENNFGNYMELGETYDVVDGRVMFDCGFRTRRYDNLEMLNRLGLSKFEEVSEELPEPSKSMLKGGDYVIDNEGCEYTVDLRFDKIVDNKQLWIGISQFEEDLTFECATLSAKEIWRNGELIAKRKEEKEVDFLTAMKWLGEDEDRTAICEGVEYKIHLNQLVRVNNGLYFGTEFMKYIDKKFIIKW